MPLRKGEQHAAIDTYGAPPKFFVSREVCLCSFTQREAYTSGSMTGIESMRSVGNESSRHICTLPEVCDIWSEIN